MSLSYSLLGSTINPLTSNTGFLVCCCLGVAGRLGLTVVVGWVLVFGLVVVFVLVLVFVGLGVGRVVVELGVGSVCSVGSVVVGLAVGSVVVGLGLSSGSYCFFNKISASIAPCQSSSSVNILWSSFVRLCGRDLDLGAGVVTVTIALFEGSVEALVGSWSSAGLCNPLYTVFWFDMVGGTALQV